MWQLLEALGARPLSQAARRSVAVVPAPPGPPPEPLLRLWQLVAAALPYLQRYLLHTLGQAVYATLHSHLAQQVARLRFAVSHAAGLAHAPLLG
jgi:hypothetical protein